MKKSFFLSCLFLSIIIAATYVSAFSVATLYGDNYPLRMNAGESKETFFLLRNVVEGDSDVNINVGLIKGSEIATFIDETRMYSVAYGEEVEVPIRIAVPLNAKAGTIYTIGAVFKPASKEGGQGNVQFLINIGKSFPVVVLGDRGEEQLSSKSSTLTIEDDQGLVETFAPFAKSSSTIWLILVMFLMMGIITITVLVIYLIFKSKDRGQIVYVQGDVGVNR